jgi:hypothetical protein|uniref:Uncharacterized protein n=1 Tax=Siphoviridae sp. ct3r22 TaxID=2825325 RepID=A0A8S5V0V0_9CAUD|nr:MAG TPA: hypothetical protein [Siphoviridae sp. ct3r22]
MNRKELLEAIEQKKCELNKLNELLSKSREEESVIKITIEGKNRKECLNLTIPTALENDVIKEVTNTLNDFKIENNKDLDEDDDLIQEFIKFAKSNNLSIYEFRL